MEEVELVILQFHSWQLIICFL